MNAIIPIIFLVLLVAPTFASPQEFDMFRVGPHCKMIYSNEISATKPIQINWTSFVGLSNTTLKLEKSDVGYYYMFIILKVKDEA